MKTLNQRLKESSKYNQLQLLLLKNLPRQQPFLWKLSLRRQPKKNIALTPTTVAEFVPVAEIEGKRVLRRQARQSIQIIVISNEETVEFINIPSGMIEETPDFVIVKKPNGTIVLTINTKSAEVTIAPVATPVVLESPFKVGELSRVKNKWESQLNGNDLYIFFAVRGETKFADFSLGENVTIKVLSRVHYLDIQNHEQGKDSDPIWVIQGMFALVKGKWFVNAGPLSLFTEERFFYSIPPERMAEVIKEESDGHNDHEAMTLGEVMQLTLIVGSNSMAQENVNSGKGGSADVTTYKNITDLWSPEDALLFIQTGDSQYLPVFPPGTTLADGTDISGQKFIPALRAGPAADSYQIFDELK